MNYDFKFGTGEDRGIQHGINFARNAIYAASKPGHSGYGIPFSDFIATFDLLYLDLVYLVLEVKRLPRHVVLRLQNLYKENLAVVVVNNIPGKCSKTLLKTG